MILKSIVLIIATVGLVSCALIEIGERVPGEELLHTETKSSILTPEGTQHSLIFVWMGNNETFSLIELDTTGYVFWSSTTPADPSSLFRWFAITVTNRPVTKLEITIRIYGLKNQYKEIGSTFKSTGAVTTTSGFNSKQ